MAPAVLAPLQPVAFSLRTKDFDELAQGIPGWDAVFSQVGPGSFRGEFDFLRLGAMNFCRISGNCEILARGAHRPGTFGFGVPTLQQRTTVVSGRPLQEGQVILLGPRDVLDQTTCTDYQSVFVEVDAAAFLAAMGALTRRDAQADLACRSCLTPSPQALRRLASWIHHALDLRLTDRDALADPTTRRQVCHGLLLRLAEVIAGGESSTAAPGRFRSRRLLVHEAEAVMDSRPDGTLTMLELCQELEVSERSLHYAFREILRQTPMAFYKHKRLNAVRRLLKQVGSSSLTVAEAGRAWGFRHTGQFAADYNRLFGELPSATVNAGSRDDQ